MLIPKNIYVKTVYLLIFSVNLYANEININKLQILATTIEVQKDIIIASENVLIHSHQYYITAQKVLYDKKNSTLELFDNVNIIKNGETTIFTNYAFLDFANEVDKFTPVLTIDNKNDIWINSTDANKSKNVLNLQNSTLSSCDCYNPAWSINFTKGDFNSTKQWINSYNTTLFINEIPVFYTPYFGFSTDQTRRTGLLRPTIGWSNNEGLLYIQPFFYASKLNWDIEYTPQIRTARGQGNHFKYRLKDSDVSLLEIKTGIFTENTSYFEQSDLKNQKHYGWDLEYERSEVFPNKSKNDQDGLLFSLHHLNDIDYLNTQPNTKSISTDKLILSEIKYFYNTNNLYSDINFKYYKDSSMDNNEETIQELPKIHLHKYSQESFIKNILYSADFKFSNNTSTTGLEAKSTHLFIPLSYSHKLLDDYLNITYSEQITLIDMNYGNHTNEYKDGQFVENKHIISISTDLLKPYANYIHTINSKISLTIPNIIKQDGDLYSITNDNSDLESFPVTKTKKNISFTLNQSIYDKKNLNQIINHQITQSIIYNDNDTSQLSDLENKLIVYYKYGILSNRLLFNYQENIIINSSSSISFEKDAFVSSLYYNYSKDTEGISSNAESYSYKDLPDAEALTYSLGYQFTRDYMLNYMEQRDLVSDIINKKEYILKIDKKCWSLNIKLADNLVVASTTTNNALRQNIFYVEVILKPILTINQEYIQKKNEG